MAELVAAGYEAIIVDDLRIALSKYQLGLKSITGREISFTKVPLVMLIYESAFEENHIDAVIHFAAYKAVGESVQALLK